MASLVARCRHLLFKIEYSLAISLESCQKSSAVGKARTIWKNMPGKLTYLHNNEGEEMAPTISRKGVTLVRKLASITLPLSVSVGDVVVLKAPDNKESYLIRRLAAIEGYEMVSSNENDEPFTLQENECWVVADNRDLKPKEAHDSRVFGPIQMTDIVGRVIYSMRTAVDHGPVVNSYYSKVYDSSVLEMELDVDEMAKRLKA